MSSPREVATVRRADLPGVPTGRGAARETGAPSQRLQAEEPGEAWQHEWALQSPAFDMPACVPSRRACVEWKRTGGAGARAVRRGPYREHASHRGSALAPGQVP